MTIPRAMTTNARLQPWFIPGRGRSIGSVADGQHVAEVAVVVVSEGDPEPARIFRGHAATGLGRLSMPDAVRRGLDVVANLGLGRAATAGEQDRRGQSDRPHVLGF